MTRYYDDKPWLKTYPEWFAPDFAAPAESVLAKFKRAADSYPEAPCIHYFDTCYSFAQVEKMAAAFAASLSDLGLNKGDRILFCTPEHTPIRHRRPCRLDAGRYCGPGQSHVHNQGFGPPAFRQWGHGHTLRGVFVR
jgi:hypothetical protein